MSPTPTRIAVLISLIGAGITWSEQAGAHAPLVSSAVQSLADDAAIHRALGLDSYQFDSRDTGDGVAATVPSVPKLVVPARSTAKAKARHAKRLAARTAHAHPAGTHTLIVAAPKVARPLASVAAAIVEPHATRSSSIAKRVADAKPARLKPAVVAKAAKPTALPGAVEPSVVRATIADDGGMSAWLANVDLPIAVRPDVLAESDPTTEGNALAPLLAGLENEASVRTIRAVDLETAHRAAKIDRLLEEVELRSIEDRVRFAELTQRRPLLVAAPIASDAGAMPERRKRVAASSETAQWQPFESLASIDARPVFERQPLLPIVHDRGDRVAPLNLILPQVPLDQLESLPSRTGAVVMAERIRVETAAIDDTRTIASASVVEAKVATPVEPSSSVPALAPLAPMPAFAPLASTPVAPLQPLESTIVVAKADPIVVRPLLTVDLPLSGAGPTSIDAPGSALALLSPTPVQPYGAPAQAHVASAKAVDHADAVDIFDPSLQASLGDDAQFDIFDPQMTVAMKSAAPITFDIFDKRLWSANKVEPLATVAAAEQATPRLTKKRSFIVAGLGEKLVFEKKDALAEAVTATAAIASSPQIVASPQVVASAKPAAPKVVEVELASNAEAAAMRAEIIAGLAAERPNPLQGKMVALSDNRLDEMRAGFDNGTGLNVSFGIERAVYVNGALVTTTTLNVADLSKMTAGQVSQSIGMDRGSAVNVIQTGPNNYFNPAQLASSSVATVVQNSLDNQKIQGITVVNATVNSLDITRRANLQNSIQNAVTDSLRR